MSKERSPCFQCERLKKDKLDCARSCEPLHEYMESLPYFLMSQDDSTSYRVPGLERREACRCLD